MYTYGYIYTYILCHTGAPSRISPGSAAPHHPEASPMGATRARATPPLKGGRRHQGVSPFIIYYILYTVEILY